MNAKVNSITSKGCVLITSEYRLLVVGYSFSLAKILILAENTQHQNTLTGTGKVLNLFTSDMGECYAANLAHDYFAMTVY